MSEYLAIKNWEQFQSSRKRFDWIKDYPAQVSDEDYCKLTFFQRHVLQELRRLRGRVGKNIPYDLHYICRETAATVPDKPRINAALTRLLHDGWLILTDQQFDSGQMSQNKKENENKKERKPSAKASPRGPLKTTDPRFHHCVDILHRYWDKFARPKIAFELWFGRVGGKQLKNSLNRHESMSVEDFTRCVANRARSPGVNHCQPAYEWLGHIVDWAGGPKTNGTGQVSKASAREQRIIDSAVRAAAAGADSGEGPDPLAIPGDGGT